MKTYKLTATATRPVSAPVLPNDFYDNAQDLFGIDFTAIPLTVKHLTKAIDNSSRFGAEVYTDMDASGKQIVIETECATMSITLRRDGKGIRTIEVWEN